MGFQNLDLGRGHEDVRESSKESDSEPKTEHLEDQEARDREATKSEAEGLERLVDQKPEDPMFGVEEEEGDLDSFMEESPFDELEKGDILVSESG